MDESSTVQRIELNQGWMEVTMRPHNVGLPRCDKPTQDLNGICILMLYGHLPHDLPCMTRPINEEKVQPMIITNVHRVAKPARGEPIQKVARF